MRSQVCSTSASRSRRSRRRLQNVVKNGSAGGTARSRNGDRGVERLSNGCICMEKWGGKHRARSHPVLNKETFSFLGTTPRLRDREANLYSCMVANLSLGSARILRGRRGVHTYACTQTHATPHDAPNFCSSAVRATRLAFPALGTWPLVLTAHVRTQTHHTTGCAELS